MEILPKVRRLERPGHELGSGRGFSEAEIKEVGLSMHMARGLGIATDIRRKTKHQENISILREWQAAAADKMPELKKTISSRRRFKRKFHKGMVYRGLTSSGRRSRGLIKSRGSKGTHRYKFRK